MPIPIFSFDRPLVWFDAKLTHLNLVELVFKTPQEIGEPWKNLYTHIDHLYRPLVGSLHAGQG